MQIDWANCLPVPDRRFCEEAAAGVGLFSLTFARHCPPPPVDRPWLCAIFDTIQDLCKNNDRIGQRRVEKVVMV